MAAGPTEQCNHNLVWAYLKWNIPFGALMIKTQKRVSPRTSTLANYVTQARLPITITWAWDNTRDGTSVPPVNIIWDITGGNNTSRTRCGGNIIYDRSGAVVNITWDGSGASVITWNGSSMRCGDRHNLRRIRCEQNDNEQLPDNNSLS